MKDFWENLWQVTSKKRVIAAILAVVIFSGTLYSAVKWTDHSEQTAQTTETDQTEVAEDSGSKTDTEAVESTEPGESTDVAKSDDDTDTKNSGKKGKKGLFDKIVGAIKGEKEETTQVSQNTGGQNQGEVPVTRYMVTFDTEGGSPISPRKVDYGSKIGTLPTPYKDQNIFVTWYYDKAKTKAASVEDTINSDLTLYAQYVDQGSIESTEQINFVSAVDVNGSNFKIQVVTDDKSMDAEAVLAGITAKNLTDPKQEDIIDVSGAGGSFTISGKNPVLEENGTQINPGFADGSTFRITLNDARLNFANEATTAREYNFTTDKKEVLNLALKDDVRYAKVEDLSNITNDGQHVSELSIALYQADGTGKLGPTELTEGTFTYTKESLEVGDVVAVYAGLRPDKRTLDTPADQNGDVAYVEITAKSGSQYEYKNAQPEDVIFEPDMLPIPVGADTDEDASTITVDNSYLDYSDDVYVNVGLDSLTTVDEGDYLMFYTGTFGIQSGDDAAQLEGYGKVISVTENDNETTTIGFASVSWEEVQQTMDIYAKEKMSGNDMIEGVDTEAIEAAIEQQAIDSGFAEEAAQYLGSLALATDNFTKLSENLNLEDYKVTLEDGTPISPEELQLMGSGVSAECKMEDGYPKATISTHPKNLGDAQGTAAANKGLSIQLEVKANITIGKSGSDNQLQITVSGVFTEEVGMDLSVRSKAVWKVWGIFPYIAEYRVTANIDVLNYTGVEVNAIMVTKESDDNDEDGNEVLDIADQIKELIDEAAGEDGEDEEKEENTDKLVKRYSEMLEEESDWIRVIEQNIVDQEKYLPPPLPIIAVKVEVTFVAKMNACVSIGFDFEYKTGKRYTYTIDVFAGKVYNDTVSLLEETYEFSFYAMGRLAVKVGLEFEFKVGLFSTKIASVGFRAEAGAYSKLWGYFYYELKYAASTGRGQKYSGALLIDVGAYLEVALKAQALSERYTTELMLYNKEWSLWTVGRQDNVRNFETIQEDMPDIKLKQHVRSTVIPDSVFSMDYLDLKDGKEKSAIYNDYFDPTQRESYKNRKNFDIRMTNDKFSYDPQTNTISVNPAAGDKKLEGDMIITWIQYPLAFSSRPIQRTIHLYWDNLRDGYVIVPYTNGGSYIGIINQKYETKIKVPANPTRQGYVFAGWYSDEDLTQPYTFPETMPAADANIYAKWEPATNIPYRVEHYKEQLESGEYVFAESETFLGTTNTYVSPEVKQYVGYNSPAKQEVRIEADGSAVLRYYYPLQWNTVTFKAGEAGGEDITYDLKYGGTVIAPQIAVKGYTFTGWDKEVDPHMGLESVVYTAQWTKNPDTEYRVEYYVQDTSGTYKLQEISNGAGYTQDVLTSAALRARQLEDGSTAEEKFAVENGVAFEKMTVAGTACDQTAIGGNGKSIIKVYYTRLKHSFTFDLGYDEKKVTDSRYYGGDVVIPSDPVRTGYTFAGWSIDGTNTVTPDTKAGTQDVTYQAIWKANTYTVKFDKNNKAAKGTMKAISCNYDEAMTLPANAFTSETYLFSGWALEKGGQVVYADGAEVLNLKAEKDAEAVLYAVWTPKEYTITYYGADGFLHANPAAYNVETETITLTAPIRTGYTFKGWYDNEACTGTPVGSIEKGSSGDRAFYAKWEANTDTAYKVEHYKENVNGGYSLADTDALVGTTDTMVTPSVKEYEGFTAPQAQEVNVNADGSTVVRYEYTRNTYTIALDTKGGTLNSDDFIKVKYGAAISLPTPVKEGYGFDGWYLGENRFNETAMPASDLTLTAKWVAGKYSYTVNHYKQNLDGSYALAQSVHGTADMDSEVKAELMNYEGFSATNEAQTIKISTDGSLNVANYYYTRNQYTLTWDLAGGEAQSEFTAGSVSYDAPITVPVLTKEGYSYSWNETPAGSMPAKDVTYTAVWTANQYTVQFSLNGGTVEGDAAAARQVTFDSPYGELPVVTKSGYDFAGWFTDAKEGTMVSGDTMVTTAADHILYAHFTPTVYTITYHGMEGAVHENPTEYNIELDTITLKDAQKAGYTFEGWYSDEAMTEQTVSMIAKGSTGNVDLYAKWTENEYRVVFEPNQGTGSMESQNFLYTEKKALNENQFARFGYTFAGWSLTADGTAAYADSAEVEKLSADANGEVHLYAVWTINFYKIIYENMDGAENAADNPTGFTVENNHIVLYDPQKTGYTFKGWYLDAEFSKPVSATMTLDSYYDWIFYAKWEANPYTITFDSCLGDTVPVETMMMSYDETKNLTLLSEMQNFEKPGYKFLGWATEKDGSVVYTDGQTVKNLAPYGNITLYAVWKQSVYQISYDLGAGGISNSNPSSYNIDDNDVKLVAPEAKEGYQFLGWYQGDTLVSEIVRGTEQDFALTAKWAHGGIFNLSYDSEEVVQLLDGSAGKKVTYKVTRTLPEGTVATANPIYVYYRTVNGTAYGSTVGIDIAGDVCHFKHTGGENVYLTFGPNDTEQTFVVEEWGAETSKNLAAAFHASSSDKYYKVELYKTVDTVGKYPGELGDGAYAQRGISGLPKYELTKDIYNKEYSYQLTSGDRKITDAGYGKNPSFNFKTFTELMNENGVSAETINYLKSNSNAGFKLNADYYEIYDGYAWMKLTTNGRLLHEEKIDIPKSKKWYNYWFPNSSTYVQVGLDERILLNLDASGSGKDDWRYGTSHVYAKLMDTRAPQQVGVANLALTQYKAGDKISITVYYDEVIASSSGVKLGNIDGLPISNAHVVIGKGNNAITFTATVDRDFEVTPDLNNAIKNLKPVTGTVKDILGN